MEKNLQLHNNLQLEKNRPVHLHHHILDILFENRSFLRKILQTINGLHEINHFSITLIDPTKKAIIFSTTPSMEYNLITEEMWAIDHGAIHASLENDSIAWWASDHQKINSIKLTHNGYSLGMTMSRYAERFTILYSFATKNRGNDLQTYYRSNIHRLIDIGDYCYKLIRDLYLNYCDVYMPPKIQSFISKIYPSQHLKLIINNCRGSN